MSQPESLTLIVVGPDAELDSAASFENLPPDAAELHSVPGKLRGFFGKEKKVDLSRLKTRMEEVQEEVDQLLQGLKRQSGGYRLAQVQVSLAISGSGSIGVATVGAEAAIALTFEPSEER